jgi:hypothetical protein
MAITDRIKPMATPRKKKARLKIRKGLEFIAGFIL